MATLERDAFLIGTAHRRLRELAAIVDGLARPWTDAAPLLRATEPIPEGWYRT